MAYLVSDFLDIFFAVYPVSHVLLSLQNCFLLWTRCWYFSSAVLIVKEKETGTLPANILPSCNWLKYLCSALGLMQDCNPHWQAGNVLQRATGTKSCLEYHASGSTVPHSPSYSRGRSRQENSKLLCNLQRRGTQRSLMLLHFPWSGLYDKVNNGKENKAY